MQQGFYELHEGIWIPALSVSGQLFWCRESQEQLFRGSHPFRYVTKAGIIRDTQPDFISDGGTKPWWTWGIVDHPYGKHLPCYYNHDSDYDKINSMPLSWIERRRKRKQADREFLESMRWLNKQLGVDSRWQSIVKRGKYRAVRMFGWIRKRGKPDANK